MWRAETVGDLIRSVRESLEPTESERGGPEGGLHYLDAGVRCQCHPDTVRMAEVRGMKAESARHMLARMVGGPVVLHIGGGWVALSLDGAA